MTGWSARLLRWPLWCWRNFLLTCLVVLGILALLGRLTAAGDARAAAGPSGLAQSTASVTSVSSAPPTAPPATRTVLSTPPALPSPVTPATPGAPGAAAAALDAAVAFVAAWAAPGSDAAAWRFGLQARAAEPLRSALSAVDPSRVPASRLEGGAQITRAGQASAQARVGTDAGPVLVDLTRSDDAWLVSGLEPGDQPPGAPTPVLTSTS